MTTPTREQVMPEPFGYVSDGFPDGLRFQHKPWPELHQLTRSVAAVYSAAQLVQAIEYAHTAGREQGLREAKEVVERERVVEPSSTGDDYAAYDEAITDCAAAIEKLRA